MKGEPPVTKYALHARTYMESSIIQPQNKYMEDNMSKKRQVTDTDQESRTIRYYDAAGNLLEAHILSRMEADEIKKEIDMLHIHHHDSQKEEKI